MATILGTVISAPVLRMTKGSEKRPATQVANISIFEKVQGADKKLADTGRVIEVGVFNPADLSMIQKGALVRVSTNGVKSSDWTRDGRSGQNHKATTNGRGLVAIAQPKAVAA